MKKSIAAALAVLMLFPVLCLCACREEPTPPDPVAYTVKAPFEERDGVICGTVANADALPLSKIVSYPDLHEAMDGEGFYYPTELYPEAGENRYTLLFYGYPEQSVTLVLNNLVFDSFRAEKKEETVYRIGEEPDLSRFSFWGYTGNERIPIPASLVQAEYLFDGEGDKEIWFYCGGLLDCLNVEVKGNAPTVLDDNRCAAGVRYRITNARTAAVCDGSGAVNAVYIPEAVCVDGVSYPVTGIDPFAFKENKAITALSCPFVSSVGESAFFGCSALKTVRLPKESCMLGPNAFSGASSLTGLTLPLDLAVLPDGVFCDCSSLSVVSLPETLSEIGSGAFMRCTSLRALTVPESVTVVGDFAFKDCPLLGPSVVLGAGLSYLGKEAFASCDALRSLVVPGSVETIGEDAFLSPSLTVYTTKGTTTAVTCMRAGVPYVKWNVDSLGVVGYKTGYELGESVEPEDYLAVWMGQDRIYRPRDLAIAYDFTVAGTRTVFVGWEESLAKWTVRVSYTEPVVAWTIPDPPPTGSTDSPRNGSLSGYLGSAALFADSRGAVYEVDEAIRTAKLISLPETPSESEVFSFADGVYVLPTELLTSGGERYAVTAVGTGAFFGRTDIRALFLHDEVKAIEAGAIDRCPNLILFYLSVPAGKGILFDEENLREANPDLLAVCALKNSITHIWVQQHKLAYVGLEAEPDYAALLRGDK